MHSGNDLWNLTEQKALDVRHIADSSGEKEILTYPHSFRSMYDMLVRSAERQGDKGAIADNENHMHTYRQLLMDTDVLADYLENTLGFQAHSRVGLLLYNSYEFCVSIFALFKLGLTAVPIPTKFREREICSLIEKSDVKGILSDIHFEHAVAPFSGKGIKIIFSENAAGEYGFSHLKTGNKLFADTRAELSSDAILMYTSGTTDQSKGVVLKNYSVIHGIMTYQKLLGITEKDSSVISSPIYHITGIVALLGLFIYAGGTLYLHKTFDAGRTLACVRDFSVTFLHASPTVYLKMLDLRTSYPALPSLRMLACGSSNMPPAKIRKLQEWLPQMEFVTVYGLTETSSPGTIFPGNAAVSPYIGSSGRPIPGTEFCIVNEEGEELPDGQVGEIAIRGTVVLDRYDKIETPLLKDGWLRTGDLGYFNEEAYLYIAGRKKDMINRGGEKICIYDVENALCRMEGVADAAVAGIPDEIYGETAAAAVVLEKGYMLEETDIRAFLKTMLAGYKIPARFLFLEKLPVTPGGKTDRKAVKKRFLQEK